MIDVNIKEILTGTNIVLKDMVSRNEGAIINISSTRFNQNEAGWEAYGARMLISK
jgi:NADP-dependent 3-hydroxy acid dehydrogenase YdfG